MLAVGSDFYRLHSFRATISVVMDYFELAQASSIRMCVELEKKFPDFRGRQLELMMYLCLIAYNSEIYDGVCDDAWLRTTITFKKDHLHQPHVFSKSESPEIRRMAELIKNGAALSQSSWRELQATLTSRIEIRCNILPRRAYWERLQDVQRQVNWIRMQSSMLWRMPCCVSRRGFFPITLVNHARENGSSLKEKVNEWRGNRGSCDLAAHLQPSVVLPTARMASLRTIEPNDVVSMESLGVGGAATVYKVSWRTGIYAMKSFKHSFGEDPVNVTFKERDMASRVLHPHIIHGFGYFEVDGKWRLLMEMLDTNLTRYAVERARVGVKPLFSHADTFDVLLQLASAMEHLHRNGVVHGDLKPDNILLDDFELLGTGRHFLAKVTDLGDAQFIVPGRAFRPAGDGTTKYAAPELLLWRTNRDGLRLAHPQKIDVYSFGGVAHEVLTGYPVYHGRSEFNRVFKRDVIEGNLKPSGSELWRNLRLEGRFPDELIKLVEKCWEYYSEDRPSFSEIREELTRCKSIVQSWVSIRSSNYFFLYDSFQFIFVFVNFSGT